MDFARSLGIAASGSKKLLTERIAAKLKGREFVEPPWTRATSTNQLSGELTAATIVPTGQRCSQSVRTSMITQVGNTFKLDAHMRDFLAKSDGTRTLQDAVNHWYATCNMQHQEIDPQFEYNLFTRGWHKQHPKGSRTDLLAAWQRYRSLPIDERGRVQ